MWRIENRALEERYKSMQMRLRGEDMEQEFFHGTPFAWDIANNGFNANYSKENNYFGKGILQVYEWK
jgi:hypothetical protein